MRLRFLGFCVVGYVVLTFCLVYMASAVAQIPGMAVFIPVPLAIAAAEASEFKKGAQVLLWAFLCLCFCVPLFVSANYNRMAMATELESPRVEYADMDEGRRTQLIELNKKAWKYNPLLVSAPRTLGDIYFARGEHKEAIKYYKAALAILPSDKNAASSLSFCQIKNDMEFSEREVKPKSAPVAH